MTLPYRLVDVFAHGPFLGNPVAVVLDASGLDTAQMLAITRWMNLSETTFLLPPAAAGADYRVRIFTLERELPFAGHPTLGSCAAWLSAGNEPAGRDAIIQECGAGLIEVRPEGAGFAFAAPPLIRSGTPSQSTIDEVCELLRIDGRDIEDAQWIDNGPGWLGVLLPSARSVVELRPKTSHPRRIDVGLVGPCEAGSAYDFEVRALFSDQHGAVREDPVTGSLNAAVAQWLIASGRAAAPFVAGQGQVVGRDGRVSVTQADGQLWVGGSTRVVVAGEISV